MTVIARNLLSLIASQFSIWMLSIVVLSVVPRYLGPAQYGQLANAAALVGFCALLSSLGTSTLITKETARDPSRLGDYVFNTLLMTTLLAALLSCATLALTYLLGYSTQARLLVGAMCLGMIISTPTGALVAGLQGAQRMGKMAVLSVGASYLTSAITIAIVINHKGLIALALAGALAGLLPLIGNGLLLRSTLWEAAKENKYIDVHLWARLARGGVPFMMWSVILTIYGSIDTPMLYKLAGDTQVGWYSLAYRLVGIPVFLASIIITVIFPALSAQQGVSPFFVTLANRALRAVAFGTIPMVAGIALVAQDAIHLFLDSNRFAQAVPSLQILALHIPVVGITMVLSSAIIANDGQKRWLVVGAIAAVVNPLLNLVAINVTLKAYGNGTIGASIITVATELIMLTGSLYLRPRGVLDSATAWYIGRCILACLPVIVAVIALGEAAVAERVLVGIVAYGLGSLVLRTVTVREAYRTGVYLLDSARPRRAPSIL